ncbi:hypothetical protein ACJ73_07309 [Blastomyces percursus]|uniref:Uncharacterized protein n=1 Tax=Blastomyces percursus TaxID=1658174 RepID=A0A1J9PYF8_9EURO|nr:hypothetical protein ACJ73_07309 [Blastomyces percursus]
MPNKWNKAKSLCLAEWLEKVNTPGKVGGVRFDFAGSVEEDGKKYNRFQVQVNAGNKISTSWKQWRESHAKGTHDKVATIKVLDNGTKDDVEAALDAVDEEID